MGDEVTANGEAAGDEVAPGSHWATVTSVLRRAGGERWRTRPASLETCRAASCATAVLVQEALVAVSDDTKHDS